ncbi:reverse transcriptase domain-containing protein [Tanacetum coccineum]
MSAVANTTPIVATVTKTANKEKTRKERDKVNIQAFCEEHYDDILPIIMDKVCRDKRKEVHTRLDFAGSSEKGQRIREGSQNSSVGVSPMRYHTSSRRPRVQDRLRYNDGNVFNRLSRRRRSVHERLSDTYSPSMTRSPRKTRMPNNVKTYDGTRDPEDHLKVFQALAQVERWAMPTWCHMFNSTLIGDARVWFDELRPESIDSYKDLKAAFLAYFMQQKKHVKDPVEIHNIKQKDGETIEEFIERFKVETGRMKGAPECMKIYGFMH